MYKLSLAISLYIDDDNRIILKPLSGSTDTQNDYINASYVDVSKILLTISIEITEFNLICLCFRVMTRFINLLLAKVNIA